MGTTREILVVITRWYEDELVTFSWVNTLSAIHFEFRFRTLGGGDCMRCDLRFSADSASYIRALMATTRLSPDLVLDASLPAEAARLRSVAFLSAESIISSQTTPIPYLPPSGTFDTANSQPPPGLS